MAEYPTAITVEMQLSGTAGAWTNVTSDVFAPDGINVKYGMSDASPKTRVADTGSMTFTLKNDTSNSAGLVGYYSPGHTNCRAGFQAGITVRLKITYDGVCYTKFYGHISSGGINIIGGIGEGKHVTVEVLDFMEQAAIHEMYLPEFTQNKRIDEIIPLIVANMPIAPLSYNLNTGDDTYATVFDTIRDKTRALTEFQKVALSELGYVYVLPDNTNTEKLVIEGRSTRYNISSLSKVSLPKSQSGFLLKEDGDCLLKEDGGKIVLNQLQTISLVDEHSAITVSHGNYLANIVSSTAYPRLIDANPVVLFSTSSRIQIAAGETKTGYSITYKDPTNRIQNVSGKNMITPVATTDYTMFANEDGTGTDLTANLAVTVDYGVEGAEYTLVNSSASIGWVWLQARGTGIYIPDPITYTASDSTSELKHGSKTLSLELKYQDDPGDAQAYMNIMLNAYKDPHTDIEEVSYIANRSELLMFAFLQVDVGRRIPLQDSTSGVVGEYFIQGTEFSIQAGGIIYWKWIVKPAKNDIFNFWQLETAGRSELEETTFIAF